MATLNVYNKKGDIVGSVNLNEELFTGKVNRSALYYYVKMYLANQRQGNACTKSRLEVSGSKKKPWKQKGTGQARAGTRRSPIWRGGGIVFGPKPRDYRQDLPLKVKRQALISALRSKIPLNSFIVIDELSLNKTPKTKDMINILDNLKLGKNVLVVTESKNDTLLKSASNLKKVEVKESLNLNAYEVLLHDKLLVTQAGLKGLENRLVKE